MAVSAFSSYSQPYGVASQTSYAPRPHLVQPQTQSVKFGCVGCDATKSAVANLPKDLPKINQWLINLIVNGYQKATRESWFKNIWQIFMPPGSCAYKNANFINCSNFGIEVLKKERNIVKATYRIAMRVMTCTPWTKNWKWAIKHFAHP